MKNEDVSSRFKKFEKSVIFKYKFYNLIVPKLTCRENGKNRLKIFSVLASI